MKTMGLRFDGVRVRYSRADLWGVSADVHEVLLAERRPWRRCELVARFPSMGVDGALDYLERLGLVEFLADGRWLGRDVGYEIV